MTIKNFDWYLYWLRSYKVTNWYLFVPLKGLKPKVADSHFYPTRGQFTVQILYLGLQALRLMIKKSNSEHLKSISWKTFYNSKTAVCLLSLSYFNVSNTFFLSLSFPVFVLFKNLQIIWQFLFEFCLFFLRMLTGICFSFYFLYPSNCCS